MKDQKKSGAVLKFFITFLVYILAAAAGYFLTAEDPFALPLLPSRGDEESVQKEEAAEEKEPSGDSGEETEYLGEKASEETGKEDAAAGKEADKAKAGELMDLAGENPWKAFESIDYCMIGDSRVSGFSIYGFLDQTRVFAEDGAVITMMRDYYTSFEALAPERVFISFGINDMLTGIWNGPDVYAAAVLEEVNALKEHAPDAVYYVNSILPALSPALDKEAVWQQVPEYNEALRKMCEENGFIYIDNDPLVEEHTGLYARDGIHVGPDFYSFWARNMLSFYAGE